MSEMEAPFAEASWLRACEELGVRGQIPFELGSAQRSFQCTAFLPDFGGQCGIAVVASTNLDDPGMFTRLSAAARARGMASSYMRIPREFEVRPFKEALLDWGFYGPAELRPPWINVV